MSGVLDGIKVLDFGRYIAGPFCAALLGDLGAEVIRIERIGGGEDRGMIPVGAGEDAGGAMFLAMNRNKRGMTLDPAAPKGPEVVRKLVAAADVVVSLGSDFMGSGAAHLRYAREFMTRRQGAPTSRRNANGALLRAPRVLRMPSG